MRGRDCPENKALNPSAAEVVGELPVLGDDDLHALPIVPPTLGLPETRVGGAIEHRHLATERLPRRQEDSSLMIGMGYQC